MTISLSANGLTTGNIAAHLEGVYDQTVDRATNSWITDDLEAWQSRSLMPIYPVLLADAIRIKIRDGTVSNRPVYVEMGVDLAGERDVSCPWVGPSGGESPKFWLGVFSELRNHNVSDTLMRCCDGLKGLAGWARQPSLSGRIRSR